mgnify:CR=1 FL=1
MTVLQLIEQLTELAEGGLGEAQVWASYNFGDYGSTEALVKPENVVFTATKKSAYSHSGLAVAEERDFDWDDEGPEPEGVYCDGVVFPSDTVPAVVLGYRRDGFYADLSNTLFAEKEAAK